MYLHLKTCSAALLEPCPSQYQGCQDARTLLAHYRRCRDIRARQAQNPVARLQHHVCLVCSLAARHARFTLDRTFTTPGCRLSSAKRDGNSSHFVPSLVLKEESFDEKSNESSTIVFSESYEDTQGLLSSGSRSQSVPPRFAFSRPVSGSREGNGRGFQALQAAVSCAIEANLPSSLSSSLDPVAEDSIGSNDLHTKNNYTRPRSESFDVKSYQYLQDEGKRSDDTKSMSYLYLAAVESLEEEPPTQSRRRSQSCSVPSANSSSRENPILNKPMGEELHCILGGDS
jgi:hypothetical protein